MGTINVDMLSPALQELISLELKHNEMKYEINKLRKEIDELKEVMLNGNDLTAYPSMLKVKDISEIFRIGSVQAYNLVRREGFPKIIDGRNIRIPKVALIKWLETAAFEVKNK